MAISKKLEIIYHNGQLTMVSQTVFVLSAVICLQ